MRTSLTRLTKIGTASEMLKNCSGGKLETKDETIIHEVLWKWSTQIAISTASRPLSQLHESMMKRVSLMTLQMQNLALDLMEHISNSDTVIV